MSRSIFFLWVGMLKVLVYLAPKLRIKISFDVSSNKWWFLEVWEPSLPLRKRLKKS